jgi:hypothetical protein
VKRLIPFVLFSFLLLSKTIYGVFWQVKFHLNQREIVRMECVNKNRPELHCNGKCYLAKQLQKAEEQLDEKKQASSRSLENLKWMETCLFACPEKMLVKMELASPYQKGKHHFHHVNFYQFENDLGCFHPPCS